MTAHCHPIPGDTAQALLAFATRAICDRRGETSEQGASRTRQLVHTALGFEPRDGLEYMLATLIHGHFSLILDSMRDVFQADPGPGTHRTKTGIVALDRAMLSMLRELRLARRRPAAQPVAVGTETAREPAARPAPRPEAQAAARTDTPGTSGSQTSAPEPSAPHTAAPTRPAPPPAATPPASQRPSSFRHTLLTTAARPLPLGGDIPGAIPGATGAPPSKTHPFSTSQNTIDGPSSNPRTESRHAEVCRNRPRGMNGRLSNARI